MRMYFSECGELDWGTSRMGEVTCHFLNNDPFVFTLGSVGSCPNSHYDLTNEGWIARSGYRGLLLISSDKAAARDMDAMEADDRSVIVVYPIEALSIYSALSECSTVYAGWAPIEDRKVQMTLVGSEGRLVYTLDGKVHVIDVDEEGNVNAYTADEAVGRTMVDIGTGDISGFSMNLWGAKAVPE